MSRDFFAEEQQPVTWVRGFAVHATHLIVAFYVLTMLVCTGFKFSQSEGLLLPLVFTSTAVLHGEIWRVATYGLVNQPSLWFVIDMAMIIWFGRELEKFFGRRVFLKLFGALYFIPPVALTLVGVWWPSMLAGQTGGLALFVALATLYPGVMMLFNIQAKWIAMILVGIYSLIALSDRNWTSLITLWSTTGFAHAFVRHAQGSFTLPSLRLRRSKPAGTVRPSTRTAEPASAPQRAAMSEMDELLDKIARSGLGSLTKKEREKLAQAREELMKKTGR